MSFRLRKDKIARQDRPARIGGKGAGMPQHDKHPKRLAIPKRLPLWRHRAYELLEHGPVGERSMRVVSRAAHPAGADQYRRGGARIGAALRGRLWEDVRRHRDRIARGVHGRICCCASGSRPSMRRTAISRRCGRAALHRLDRRPHRPRLGAAVLARLRGAVRIPHHPAVPHRALPQARPLFAGAALAASKRSIPSGARCSAASSSSPARR